MKLTVGLELSLPYILLFSECGEAGCVFQCPYQSGRDAVCKCPRGPRVPTGELNEENFILKLTN
jgi:hypothetical protein